MATKQFLFNDFEIVENIGLNVVDSSFEVMKDGGQSSNIDTYFLNSSLKLKLPKEKFLTFIISNLKFQYDILTWISGQSCKIYFSKDDIDYTLCGTLSNSIINNTVLNFATVFDSVQDIYIRFDFILTSSTNTSPLKINLDYIEFTYDNDFSMFLLRSELSVYISDFVTRIELDNYYTKLQIDDIIANLPAGGSSSDMSGVVDELKKIRLLLI